MSTNAIVRLEIPIANTLFLRLLAQPSNLLSILSKENAQQISDHVVEQLKDRDGGPVLTDLHLLKFRYDESTGEGSFRLHFRISRQYCCSDISGCADDYLDFKFVYRNENFVAEAAYFQWSLDN